MHALIVYESMFGNTGRVAEAIGTGLSVRYQVEMLEVGAAPKLLPTALDLLVVGGPTHAFGMSRESTRQSAVQQGASAGLERAGIREWLEAIAVDTRRVAAASFDTRVDRPRLPGSAANAAARRLRRMGMRLVLPPESFYVEGVSGPLIEGELERAQSWGEMLASQLRSVQTV